MGRAGRLGEESRARPATHLGRLQKGAGAARHRTRPRSRLPPAPRLPPRGAPSPQPGGGHGRTQAASIFSPQRSRWPARPLSASSRPDAADRSRAPRATLTGAGPGSRLTSGAAAEATAGLGQLGWGNWARRRRRQSRAAAGGGSWTRRRLARPGNAARPTAPYGKTEGERDRGAGGVSAGPAGGETGAASRAGRRRARVHRGSPAPGLVPLPGSSPPCAAPSPGPSGPTRGRTLHLLGAGVRTSVPPPPAAAAAAPCPPRAQRGAGAACRLLGPRSPPPPLRVRRDRPAAARERGWRCGSAAPRPRAHTHTRARARGNARRAALSLQEPSASLPLAPRPRRCQSRLIALGSGFNYQVVKRGWCSSW